MDIDSEEDIQTNPFFVALQTNKKLQSFYEAVFTTPGNIICVPSRRSLPSSRVYNTKEFIKTHILSPMIQDGDTDEANVDYTTSRQYVNLSGESVFIKSRDNATYLDYYARNSSTDTDKKPSQLSHNLNSSYSSGNRDVNLTLNATKSKPHSEIDKNIDRNTFVSSLPSTSSLATFGISALSQSTKKNNSMSSPELFSPSADTTLEPVISNHFSYEMDSKIKEKPVLCTPFDSDLEHNPILTISSRILFEELCYNDDFDQCRVLCIMDALIDPKLSDKLYVENSFFAFYAKKQIKKLGSSLPRSVPKLNISTNTNGNIGSPPFDHFQSSLSPDISPFLGSSSAPSRHIPSFQPLDIFDSSLSTSLLSSQVPNVPDLPHNDISQRQSTLSPSHVTLSEKSFDLSFAPVARITQRLNDLRSQIYTQSTRCFVDYEYDPSQSEVLYPETDAFSNGGILPNSRNNEFSGVTTNTPGSNNNSNNSNANHSVITQSTIGLTHPTGIISPLTMSTRIRRYDDAVYLEKWETSSLVERKSPQERIRFLHFWFTTKGAQEHLLSAAEVLTITTTFERITRNLKNSIRKLREREKDVARKRHSIRLRLNQLHITSKEIACENNPFFSSPEQCEDDILKEFDGLNLITEFSDTHLLLDFDTCIPAKTENFDSKSDTEEKIIQRTISEGNKRSSEDTNGKNANSPRLSHAEASSTKAIPALSLLEDHADIDNSLASILPLSSLTSLEILDALSPQDALNILSTFSVESELNFLCENALSEGAKHFEALVDKVGNRVIDAVGSRVETACSRRTALAVSSGLSSTDFALRRDIRIAVHSYCIAVLKESTLSLTEKALWTKQHTFSLAASQLRSAKLSHFGLDSTLLQLADYEIPYTDIPTLLRESDLGESFYCEENDSTVEHWLRPAWENEEKLSAFNVQMAPLAVNTKDKISTTSISTQKSDDGKVLKKTTKENDGISNTSLVTVVPSTVDDPLSLLMRMAEEDANGEKSESKIDYGGESKRERATSLQSLDERMFSNTTDSLNENEEEEGKEGEETIVNNESYPDDYIHLRRSNSCRTSISLHSKLESGIDKEVDFITKIEIEKEYEYKHAHDHEKEKEKEKEKRYSVEKPELFTSLAISYSGSDGIPSLITSQDGLAHVFCTEAQKQDSKVPHSLPFGFAAAQKLLSLRSLTNFDSEPLQGLLLLHDVYILVQSELEFRIEYVKYRKKYQEKQVNSYPQVDTMETVCITADEIIPILAFIIARTYNTPLSSVGMTKPRSPSPTTENASTCLASTTSIGTTGSTVLMEKNDVMSSERDSVILSSSQSTIPTIVMTDNVDIPMMSEGDMSQQTIKIASLPVMSSLGYTRGRSGGRASDIVLYSHSSTSSSISAVSTKRSSIVSSRSFIPHPPSALADFLIFLHLCFHYLPSMTLLPARCDEYMCSLAHFMAAAELIMTGTAQELCLREEERILEEKKSAMEQALLQKKILFDRTQSRLVSLFGLDSAVAGESSFDMEPHFMSNENSNKVFHSANRVRGVSDKISVDISSLESFSNTYFHSRESRLSLDNSAPSIFHETNTITTAYPTSYPTSKQPQRGQAMREKLVESLLRSSTDETRSSNNNVVEDPLRLSLSTRSK